MLTEPWTGSCYHPVTFMLGGLMVHNAERGAAYTVVHKVWEVVSYERDALRVRLNTWVNTITKTDTCWH